MGEGQRDRKEGSPGRRHEKLEQELRALGRAGEMTVEIRTGAKRSEQKGTAGTKTFKEGRNNERSGQKKSKLSLAERARDSCVSHQRGLCRPQQMPCHSEMALKGGMDYTPTINIKFYACCTFQKPEEDIDSSKCRIFT